MAKALNLTPVAAVLPFARALQAAVGRDADPAKTSAAHAHDLFALNAQSSQQAFFTALLSRRLWLSDDMLQTMVRQFPPATQALGQWFEQDNTPFPGPEEEFVNAVAAWWSHHHPRAVELAPLSAAPYAFKRRGDALEPLVKRSRHEEVDPTPDEQDRSGFVNQLKLLDTTQHKDVQRRPSVEVPTDVGFICFWCGDPGHTVRKCKKYRAGTPPVPGLYPALGNTYRMRSGFIYPSTMNDAQIDAHVQAHLIQPPRNRGAHDRSRERRGRHNDDASGSGSRIHPRRR